MARPRSQQARSAMLEAAAHIVLTEGMPGFSIDEVSRRSGVAKTTIYRHFASRNELLVAALDGAMPVPDTPDNGTLRADLVAFLGNVLPIFADSCVRAATLEIFAAAARDPDLDRLQRAMVHGRDGPLQTIYERGRARGEIGADIDFSVFFDYVEGPLIVRALLRPEGLFELDLEAVVERVLAVVGDGESRS